jgi:Outer membrane protein beta-barrel domain
MKRFVQVASAVCVAAFGVAGQAAAQPKGDRPVSVQINGGVSVGNKTSGTYGVEGDYQLNPKLTIFAELGQVGNVAPQFISDRADLVAAEIGATADVQDKATYFDLGVKYTLTTFGGGYQPYAGLGIGVAKVSKTTTFTIGGATISEADLLSQYGVQLGSDLSGSTTKTNLTVMVGVTRAIGERLGADLSYRYSRLFPKTDVIEGDMGINVQRIQAGFFVRF